jgi:hypothetical protein
MSDDLDPEVVAQLAVQLGRQRGYASFHQWHDRQVMERGIVTDLLGSIPEEFRMTCASVASLAQDPPDCLVESDGVRIGVEVTELVDQAFLEAVVIATRAGATIYDWASWDRDKFVAQLRSRISAKARPSVVFGGPFDEYVLLIHTAEPGLAVPDVQEWLRELAPIPAGVITRGFLLFDYRPGEGRAVVRLPLLHD